MKPLNFEELKSRIHVALNPGHAPNTPGKRDPDGRLLEWEWNLQAADATARLLCANGYNVHIARAMDEKVSLTGPVQFTNTLCNKYGKGNVLFISLHCNAAQGKGWVKAKGWEIWTTKGETESDVLAEHIYAAASRVMEGRVLRHNTSDGDHDKEENFYVLRKTNCPAVLLESGFMNDKEECEYLLSDISKEHTSQLILHGLESYLKSKVTSQSK